MWEFEDALKRAKLTCRSSLRRRFSRGFYVNDAPEFERGWRVNVQTANYVRMRWRNLQNARSRRPTCAAYSMAGDAGQLSSAYATAATALMKALAAAAIARGAPACARLEMLLRDELDVAPRPKSSSWQSGCGRGGDCDRAQRLNGIPFPWTLFRRSRLGA